jgi:hypothetical protein
MNQYFSSLKENINIGTAVTTVRAVDGDLGSNSKVNKESNINGFFNQCTNDILFVKLSQQIIYTLVNSEGMLDFNITTQEVFDPGSQSKLFIGRIHSARDLDRESRASYNLTVRYICTVKLIQQ